MPKGFGRNQSSPEQPRSRGIKYLPWWGFGVLLASLVVSAVAVWQHWEYRREKAGWSKNLESQGRAILAAIIGGIKGHRRMGQFFLDQVEGMLSEIASLPHVRGVAVVAEKGGVKIAKGELVVETDPLRASPGFDSGVRWTDDGVWLAETFELDPEPPPGGRGEPRRGEGRGPRWREGAASWGLENWFAPPERSPPAFIQGGTFRAVLVLNRQEFDLQCRRAAALRTLIVALTSLWAVATIVAVGALLQKQRLAASRDLLSLELRHREALAAAASGLAHETRNPLNMIRMRAQTLVEHPAEEVSSAAGAIVEECDRLATRINQFLAFAAPVVPQAESVDCEELLRELQAVLEPDLAERGVSLRWEVAPSTRYLRLDRELLRQVLFNLLNNAVAFSPPHESVEMHLTPLPGKKWKIEVLDRGPGVAEDVRSKLFTPYFSTRPGGTGLGLAIVARICDVCGWQVSYHPRPGGGACFQIVGSHDAAAANGAHCG